MQKSTGLMAGPYRQESMTSGKWRCMFYCPGMPYEYMSGQKA